MVLDRRGIPFVLARIHVPRAGTSAIVRLVVDTGASDIALSETDSRRLRVDLDGLDLLRTEFIGVGGKASGFDLGSIDVQLFCEGGGSRVFHLRSARVLANPRIGADDQREVLLPSFLGRRFMEGAKTILHWDFGRNVAHLDLPD